MTDFIDGRTDHEYLDSDRPAPILAPGQTPPEDLIRWVKDGLYYTHPLRVEEVSTNRRAELYDACIQWLQKASHGYDQAGAHSTWVPYWQHPLDPDYVPKPVFNEGLDCRMNESARLGRPKYQPTTRAKGPSGILERVAAKNMEHQLRHRLREMGWDKEEDLVYYHMPVYGGVWISSELVLSWDQTTTIPNPEAVRCSKPECSFAAASPDVPLDRVHARQMGAGNAMSAPYDRNAPAQTVHLDACPDCPEHPPLEPYRATLEEARTQRDSFGQPLGKKVPLGDWFARVRSPYDVFAADLGLDSEQGKVNGWTECHVETLDWVAKRFPKIAGRVRPENPATLAKYHPIAGAPNLFQGVMGSKVFRNHVRVIERHTMPRMVLDPRTGVPTMDRGRSVVIAGDQVGLDDHYMLDSINYPGERVARKIMEYIPWELREGGRRLRGLSQWEILFDPNDTSNTIRSQSAAVRERHAVPLYVAFKQHNLQMLKLGGGVPGRLAVIDAFPESHPVLPQLMNNTTIDAGVYRELEDTLNAISRLGQNPRIEQGQADPGVDAAAALRALKESSGEGREKRIGRIATGFRNVFTHGKDVMRAFYIEPRECRYEDEDGEDRWEMFDATKASLASGKSIGADMEVDVEPDEPDEEEKRLKVKDALASGAIPPDKLAMDRRFQRKVAQFLDLPPDLYEFDDLQEKAAQREWVAFKDQNQRRVPYQDPTLDDHSTHYEEHGRAAHSDWFRDLEEKAGWDEALKVLSVGWFEDLQAFQFMPPMPGQPCLQDLILDHWLQKLAMASMTGYVPKDPDALAQVLTWRAHMEAHRLEDERKQMRAAITPTLAAPGTEATAAGNQVTAGAPAAAPTMMPRPGAMSQPAGAA